MIKFRIDFLSRSNLRNNHISLKYLHLLAHERHIVIKQFFHNTNIMKACSFNCRTIHINRFKYCHRSKVSSATHGPVDALHVRNILFIIKLKCNCATKMMRSSLFSHAFIIVINFQDNTINRIAITTRNGLNNLNYHFWGRMVNFHVKNTFKAQFRNQTKSFSKTFFFFKALDNIPSNKAKISVSALLVT